MSTIKTNNAQIGQSITTTNNFTLYQPATPDGTVRLGNGNAGSVTDIVTLNSSGNVGIGTSSPAVKLDVASASTTQVRVQMTGQADMRIGSDTGVARLGTYSNHPLLFYTNTTEQMRLDSSGNLGLGVTPSAWSSSGAKMLQVGRANLVGTTAASDLYLNANSYYNTGWKYIADGYATRYSQNDVSNGAHAWFTAPSGTAGNAITFTQAMTLDTNYNLTLNAGGGFVTTKSGIYPEGAGSLYTTTGYLRFSNGASETMRIDSSGRLLVGATSQSAGMNGGLFTVGNGAAGRQFTAASGATFINGDSGTWAIGHYMIGGSGTNRGGFGASGAADTLSYYWVGQSYSGTGVQLANGGTSWSSLSDVRDKNVHGAIDLALEKVSAISPVYYNYKSDEVDARRRVGVIAQEVQAVFPEAVTELQREIDNPTEETKRLTVAYTELVPLLIGAIQELKAELDATKAEVAALKGA